MQIRTARDGESTGVWNTSDLQGALDRGKVLGTDLVWKSGDPEWQVLADVATELGITLPNLEDKRSEVPPPIPMRTAPVAPQSLIPPRPLANNPKTSDPPPVPSALNAGELVFKKRRKTTYGFGSGTKLVFVLILLVGGWYFVDKILPRVDYQPAEGLTFKKAGSIPDVAVTAGRPNPSLQPTSEATAEDAGGDRCMELSRAWMVATRELEATGGLGAMQTKSNLAVTRVAEGCLGVESPEEKVYRADERREQAEREREYDARKLADDAAAERRRVAQEEERQRDDAAYDAKKERERIEREESIRIGREEWERQ